eukprot:CAMPEP_0183503688 /NCGR_PEP_ID=MMETSP0371-20130417/5308_1 /TAXON_ID=268820 /ORGANISM="Peridinium aciculiferum, Strain PAER-2" /LENGTH=668 /DNA_ID=CAMNT_0025698865 /DNA_START=46 /DNA_END=2052 /DNA_ORIENTATION=-
MSLRLGALLAPALALASQGVTPAQQVVTMLGNMQATGVAAKEEEKKTFDKYARWADEQSKDLALEIKDTSAKIEELIAFATKADSDAKELGNQISGLDAEIDKLEKEKQEGTDDRKEQHEEYLKVSQDYSESVEALQQAISVLSSQDYDRAQAESMLQKMARTVPGMPRVLAAFVQEQQGGSSGFLQQRAPVDGAPAVSGYEFQSSKILDTLKALLDKFRGELGDVNEAEANEAHAFSMAELHLSNTISADRRDNEEKTVERAKRMQESAQAKGELAIAKDDKAADEKLKEEIDATFAVKKGAFEENQQVRAAELEAIGKAVEILSSADVQAGYSKHIALEQQHASGISFLQLRRSHRRVGTKDRVSEFLSKKATALKSKMLAKLVSDISTNPFAKVIDMVETLIEKLKEEAASEADHKAWCDKELKSNKQKRKDKTAQAEKLMAEIESFTSTIAEMAESIEELATEQAKLQTAMTEATTIRTDEKAKNEVAVKDAAAGAAAVERALAVLKDFYEAQSAAFVQQGHKQVPEMAVYKGLQSENGGVIGMLEVVMSDFNRLKTETEANEAAAAKEYADFMASSEATKKEKHDSEFKLSLDKDESEFKKSQAEKDLKNTQEELAQANNYYNELKPSCVQVHVSFEERVTGRKEEIAALHEAWTTLDQKAQE